LELPDLTEATDDELATWATRIAEERRRRAVLDEAPAKADKLSRVYLDAAGAQQGDDWSQPVGAFDAYPKGWTVTHDGKTWQSLVPANVWEPSVAAWREVTDDGSPPEWVKPSGYADAYEVGDLVTYHDQVYRSLIDGNVWSPDTYPAGWEQVD
jgi:hypothetical protein